MSSRACRPGLLFSPLSQPLLKPGLSFMQRLHYFASLFYFFHGWARLIYLCAPLAYLWLGTPPLLAKASMLLNYFLPYYLTSLMAFALMSRGHRNPFWSDVYETAMCFSISWAALETLFRPKKTEFHVTPKDLQRSRPALDWLPILPHLALAALLILGMPAGSYQFSFRRTLSLDGTLLSAFWSLYNFFMLTAAIAVARERAQRRSSPRLPRQLPCRLKFNGTALPGTTCDLSETGVSLSIAERTPIPRIVQWTLQGEPGETLELEGEVVRNDARIWGTPEIGIRFLNVNEEQKQILVRRMFSHPSSWEKKACSSSAWSSLRCLLTSLRRGSREDLSARRGSPRVTKQIACALLAEESIWEGTTEDLSFTGLRVRLKTERGLPERLTVRLLGK